jgi:hypothetical protein
LLGWAGAGSGLLGMVKFGFLRYSVRRRRPYLSCSFRGRLLVSCRWAYLCSASSLEVWIWSRCHQCNDWSSRFQIQVLTALFILCIHIPDSLSESAASAVSADLCHTNEGMKALVAPPPPPSYRSHSTWPPCWSHWPTV